MTDAPPRPTPSRPRSSRGPDRRALLRLGVAAPAAYAVGLAGPAPAAPAPATPTAPIDDTTRWSRDVRALERSYDATVGFEAVNLRTGASLRHRADTRFPILSVFKTFAAAATLRGVSTAELGRRVFFPPADVLSYAPVAAERVEEGMTIAELCDAALRYSDNTAANLLLREIGGPRGLTAFARSLGDEVTRLDRWEEDLNSALPGDPRDTTTPRAVATSFTTLLEGRALAGPDRRRLRGWMLRNTTSDDRFRAGLPDGWRLADKTGSGAYGCLNDVGVAYGPAGERLVLAALTRRDRADDVGEPALLADLAALAVRRLTT